MLTIPKLTHGISHRKNRTQDQLFYDSITSQKIISNGNRHPERRIQSSYQSNTYIRNKENILKKPTLISSENWQKDLQQLKIRNKLFSQHFLNHEQIFNSPSVKQNKLKREHNHSNIQVAQSVQACFSPKYQKERQKNHHLLLSLKLQNEKCKRLIEENQLFYKLEQNFQIKQFQVDENIKALPKNNVKSQFKKNNLNSTRKALQEMTNLTSSFIVDSFLQQKNIEQNFVQNSFKNQKLSTTDIKPKIQDFSKIKFLGKGNFGEVNLVKHNQTNFICAMKTIKKSFIKEQNMTHQICRQIKIHLSLKHLNIIGFYGFFDDVENFYILTEYATGGELYQKLKQTYRMPQQQVVPIVKNISEGLKMIHSLGYIHRDLKPENVIFQFGIAKICDLGWAAECRYNETRNSFCGTPLYLSPEMVKKESYDQMIDIWALGILAYELLVGKVPFNIWSEYDLQQIVDKDIVFPTSYVDMSSESIDFIKKCLTKNPIQRINANKLYNHPFINENKNGYFNVEAYDAIENLFSS